MSVALTRCAARFVMAIGLLAGASAHAATLFVNRASPTCTDTGTGSQSAPYCTISAAVARAIPGTTVSVQTGTYREMVTVPVSGTATFPILIQGAGPGVVVDGSDDFSSPALWALVSGSVYLASTVTWNPVQVFADGTRLAPSTGLPPSSLLPGTFSYLAGQGLYINLGGGNPGAHSLFVGRRSSAFRIIGKSWVTISDFTVTRTEDSAISVTNTSSDFAILRNTVTFAAKRGIHVSASVNAHIASNRVSDCADHGIYLVSGVSGAVVEDNESFRNARPASRAANGIQLWGSSGNVLQRNRLHDNQDTGLQISTSSNDNLSVQNLSWSNGDHGYHHQASTGTRHIGDVARANVNDGFALEGGSTGTQIHDCISSDNGLTTGSFDLFADATSTTGFASNFNVIWNSTSQAPVRYGSSIYPTLAAYAAATGQDVRSIQGDPRLVDPMIGNFALMPGSPAIDSADSSVPGWPSTDASGISRIDDPSVPNTGAGPVLYGDRGALEFAHNAPPDGIITTPATNVTLSRGQSVQFSATATDPDGNAPLVYRWDFGGGAPVQTVLNPGPVMFSTAGTFTVTFTVTDSKGLADPTPATRVVTVLNVNLPPNGSIDVPASNPTISACGNVTFAGSGFDPDGNLPLTYRWDFGGGAPSQTVEDPGAVSFASPGTYTVAFTVTDALGSSDASPDTRVVTVLPATINDEIHWTLTGQTTVTFDWRGPDDTIQYGLTSAYGHSVTARAPSPMPISSCGPFREARIEGLQENTLYHYSIGNTGDHTFRTPLPRGGSDFTVFAEGDIGETSTYPLMGNVQSLIAADRPAFTLMLGDLTYANDHGQSKVDQHFNDVMSWSQDSAYMAVLGNHEWDTVGHCSGTTSLDCNMNADCPQGQTCQSIGDDLRNYKGRFEFPNPMESPGVPVISGGGEDWYWFDYGNIRFIAYPEPYGSQTWTDWFDRAYRIMDDAQNDPAIRYIVTFGHRPAYSSGHHPGSQTLSDKLDALGDSHSKYVLNMNGHSHGYERTTPQSGVIHVTVGTGGATLEEDGDCLWLMCAQPSWSAYRAFYLGALRLHFSETGIEGRFICGPPGGGENDVNCAEGSVLDTFSIPPAPPVARIDSPPSNVTILSGQSVQFGGSATDPNHYVPLNYHWNFGGAAPNRTVEDPGPVVFANPGTYTVTLDVTNALGIPDPTPETRVIVVRPIRSRNPFDAVRP